MKKLFDTKYGQISFYVILTVGICYALKLLLDMSGGVILGVVGVVSWIFSVLAPFVLGLILAYLLLPVVDFVSKLLNKVPFLGKKKGICRGLSILITIVALGFALFMLLSLIVSSFTSNLHFVSFEELKAIAASLWDQISNFYEGIRKILRNYEVYIPSFNKLVEMAKESLNKINGSDGASFVTALGTGMIGVMNTVKNTVVKWGLAIIFSVYFLYDSEGMSKYWDRAFKAILGEKAHGVAKIAVKDLDKCFAGYIRGQLADAIFMAIVVSIAFAIAGVPYAALIGVCTGIGNLVPYVGPFVAYGMTALSCLMKGDLKMLVIGVIIVFIIQTIDGNIINPKLLSNSVDVHPVLVIIALLFGGSIGGFLGMVVAVPVAAFLRIQFERFVEYRNKGFEG